MNLFEIASRSKLRFRTARGELTVEQLWDLPLKSKNSLSLDDVAIRLDEFRKRDNISFVEEKTNEQKDVDVLFEIVLHIIKTKKEQIKEQEERNGALSTLRILKEIKEKKELSNLENLTDEELDKKIAELKAKL